MRRCTPGKRRRMLGLSVAVLTWLLAAAPASAGGWWSYVHVDGPYLGVGETMVAHAEAFFPTVAQAEEAQHRQFYAYLVRGHDRALLRRAMSRPEPTRWWALVPDAELIRVGRVQIANWDANLGDASARITIPDVGSGRWNLMFCDLGCRQPMGSAVPTAVRVTGDAQTAQTARRVARLEERSREAISELRMGLRDARTAAAAATADAASTHRQLDDVMRRVGALEVPADQPPSRSWWPWPVALAVLTGGAALATRRRRAAAEAAPAQEAVAGDAAWESGTTFVGAGSRVRR